MKKICFVIRTIIITTFYISFQNQFIILSFHPSLNHHQQPMENKKNDIQYLKVITHFFSSCTAFLLLPTLYCGLDGVLFDDDQKGVPLDVNFKLFILFLESLRLKITCWSGIVNIFELVVCWLDAHKLFLFLISEANRHNNLKNEIR